MTTQQAQQLIERRMSDSQANIIFNEIFNGHSNFMTPNTIWRKMFDNYAIELSSGQAIFQPERDNYGVTVIKDNKHNTDLSDLFTSRKEAEDYILQLVTTEPPSQ